VVEQFFKVREHATVRGIPTFWVELEPDMQAKFRSLLSTIRSQNLIAVLSEDQGLGKISILRAPRARRRSRLFYAALLVVTLATVCYSGFIHVKSFNESLRELGREPVHVLSNTVAFAVSLFFILGLHELSHMFASVKHGKRPTPPMFIPGPPPLGTLGAVILSEEPLVDMDEVLDTGFSGPLASFLVSLAVLAVGLPASVRVPEEVVARWIAAKKAQLIPTPLAYQLVEMLVARGSGAYLLSPVAWAGWAGLYVTFLNLLPIGQLDGGHIVYSLFHGRASAHLLLSAAGLLVLFYTNPAMAILVLALLLMAPSHPPPLDRVSKVAGRRRAIYLAAYALMLALSCPIPAS